MNRYDILLGKGSSIKVSLTKRELDELFSNPPIYGRSLLENIVTRSPFTAAIRKEKIKDNEMIMMPSIGIGVKVPTYPMITTLDTSV